MLRLTVILCEIVSLMIDDVRAKRGVDRSYSRMCDLRVEHQVGWEYLVTHRIVLPELSTHLDRRSAQLGPRVPR
ncbi:glucomannan 4-beta-mannosyltransferase 9 [Dorcoceras hygrometricum]|uniref:Glucomannan 4-beta-mannosyltransferase 9 n=1 Tax=Dorcoceras hygrometricum TaxID=472368 RepID=A0A2Z7ATU0_9LAMI|nr:glucomannan 4-beta-mannosyltransferase 9 [Dorcoceras hygrometricum]